MSTLKSNVPVVTNFIKNTIIVVSPVRQSFYNISYVVGALNLVEIAGSFEDVGAIEQN